MPKFEGLTDYLGRTIRPILGKYTTEDYREIKVDADGKLVVDAGLISVGDIHPYGYNGATWDEWRNNVEVELLASGARTGNTWSPLQTNYNHCGLLVFLDITARTVGVSPLIAMRLDLKHGTGTSYYCTFISPNFDPEIGRHAMVVYPGLAAPVTGTLEKVRAYGSFPLPRHYDVGIAFAADVTSLTYSLVASPVV